MFYKLLFLFLAAAIFPAAPAHARSVADGNFIMDQSMEENLCALTFDDGPSPFTTPHLLEQLEQNGIKATFFLLGSNAARYPRIVELIKNGGHEIGNHSWSHANLKHLNVEKQKEEICRTDEVLRSQGVTPLYLRPPYGSFDGRTVRIAEELGLSLILWSLDSHDWKHLPVNYAKLLSTRGTTYEDGSLRGIFLFHDIHKTTVDDLPRILENLRAGGCDRFVTVSEYLMGLSDLEPPQVMTRRPNKKAVAAAPMIPAKAGSESYARCSMPRSLKYPQPDKTMDLESAHAQAQAPNDASGRFH